MERLHVFLVILQGVGCLRWISASACEKTVRPGDNITLYCDCKPSTGEFIVWYRNCSHENQPSLVLERSLDALKLSVDAGGVLNPLPRFYFVKNQSSTSYDLQIVNITDSDLGLYYCGTEQVKVLDKERITKEKVYTHGNMTTRVVFNSSEPYSRRPPSPPCSVCWMLLFSLCPALAVVSSLLSSALVYHLCKKTACKPKVEEVRPDSRGQTRGNEDEDVCYSSVNIRQTSQRPNKKTQSSDFSTYSIINTSRV